MAAATADFPRAITVLRDTIPRYDLVKDDKNLREAFHEAGKGLPLVKEALETVEFKLAKGNSAKDLQNAVDSLKKFNNNAELSKCIFDAVAKAPSASRFEVYKKIVKEKAKGRTVETLVMEMMNDVFVLTQNNVIGVEMEKQANGLRDAVEKLSEMGSSISNEGLSRMHNHYGSGDQYNAPGGTQNISKGDGNQFPGATFSGSVTFGK